MQTRPELSPLNAGLALEAAARQRSEQMLVAMQTPEVEREYGDAWSTGRAFAIKSRESKVDLP